MRLLHTTEYILKDHIAPIPEYAILSHKWLKDKDGNGIEITFKSFNTRQLKGQMRIEPQFIRSLEKIRGACEQARKDKMQWLWIDTCCIDKSSSTEVAKSLRSMFNWYRGAAFCYTYLDDVSKSGANAASLKQASGEPAGWFKRGWTLQELLAPAPRQMTFFDAHWRAINTKFDLAEVIESITRIDARFVREHEDFRNASIAQRLSWVAGRTTTEKEDIVYSLFGILDISLTPMYGEGEGGAFMRLQQEIVKECPDESIFAWTAPAESLPHHDRSSSWDREEWGLLAPSPDCFRDSHDIIVGRPFRDRPTSGITVKPYGVCFPMTHKELKTGSRWLIPLHFVVPFSPVIIHKIKHKKRTVFTISLNCWREDESGSLRPIMIYLSRDGEGDGTWRRRECSELGLDQKMANDSLTRVSVDVIVVQPNGVQWPKP